MDTSNTYIKMCAHHEICSRKPDSLIAHEPPGDYPDWEPDLGELWELAQQPARLHPRLNGEMFCTLEDFSRAVLFDDYYARFESIEQLLLGYIMRAKLLVPFGRRESAPMWLWVDNAWITF